MYMYWLREIKFFGLVFSLSIDLKLVCSFPPPDEEADLLVLQRHYLLPFDAKSISNVICCLENNKR